MMVVVTRRLDHVGTGADGRLMTLSGIRPRRQALPGLPIADQLCVSAAGPMAAAAPAAGFLETLSTERSVVFAPGTATESATLAFRHPSPRGSGMLSTHASGLEGVKACRATSFAPGAWWDLW